MKIVGFGYIFSIVFVTWPFKTWTILPGLWVQLIFLTKIAQRSHKSPHIVHQVVGPFSNQTLKWSNFECVQNIVYPIFRSPGIFKKAKLGTILKNGYLSISLLFSRNQMVKVCPVTKCWYCLAQETRLKVKSSDSFRQIGFENI